MNERTKKAIEALMAAVYEESALQYSFSEEGAAAETDKARAELEAAIEAEAMEAHREGSG